MSSKGYEFWLHANGGTDKLQLPVNPESITVKCSADNLTYKVDSLGEVVFPVSSRKAMTVSFSSFFPSRKFSGYKLKTLKSPTWIIEKIKKWMESDKPVKLIVTQCKIDMYCVIESFEYSEKGGDVGTYNYSISLKEYRAVQIQKVNVSKTTKKAAVAKTGTKRVSNKTAPKTHKVKSGDCLWNIAKKYYGDGSQYTKIYEANKNIIGSNPNLIKPGQVLTIP
ncbi:MAG: LysM peptidoglycan-binding domain-containing protein [Porcipelethomonas sp.]